jgi:hypothetical protein
MGADAAGTAHADSTQRANPATQLEPGAPPPPTTVEATFSVTGDLGIVFAFPFIESIDPDGAAAAVPGLRPGLMLQEVESPAGRVTDAHRLGEAGGMCVVSSQLDIFYLSHP